MAPSVPHFDRAKRASPRDAVRLGAQIGQLLAAVGSKPVLDPAPPEVTPYDWRDPHCFNADQQNRLVQVLGQVAARMAEVFTRSRGGVCAVSLKALTQHFAGDACRRMELDQNYCMTFAPEKGQPCGFLTISPQTTGAWVTWLLGDADSTRAPNQALSALEESLLSDLLTTVLEAFLAPLRSQHNLRPTGIVCQGQPTLAFELTEEICLIVFQVKSPDPGEPAEITLVVPCSSLAALAGKVIATTPFKITPQELSRVLMEHVQEMPVTVRATLASTALTFQEVLDLGSGDILLLDKRLDGLTELTLDGRTICRGRPAQAQGRCAVVVIESETAGTPPAATPKASKPVVANERT